MTKYSRLARAEKAATEAQETAQADYRQAWWNLTLAMAEAATPSEVYDEVAPILGLSRSYLSSRRKLAQQVSADVIESGEVYTLPPRKALAWIQAKAGPINHGAVERLRQFEEEGVSLRAMAQELGHNIPSWQNAAQRDAELAAARNAQLTPEIVAKALRESAEFRRAVVTDHETFGVLHADRMQHNRDFVRNNSGPVRPARVDHDDDEFESFFAIDNALAHAENHLRRAARLMADHGANEQEVRTWLSRLANLELITHGMSQLLTTGAQFDSALRDLLIQEGAE